MCGGMCVCARVRVCISRLLRTKCVHKNRKVFLFLVTVSENDLSEVPL